MSKIVTKKAHFLLEAVGFSILTFEISKKNNKTNGIHVRCGCMIQGREFATLKVGQKYRIPLAALEEFVRAALE